MKLVMKGCVITDNHNVGLFIDGDADVSLENTEIARNRGPGIIARSSAIPPDMLQAIRQAFEQGQTPAQVETTFGDRLKSLGRPIGGLVQAGANAAKIWEFLHS